MIKHIFTTVLFIHLMNISQAQTPYVSKFPYEKYKGGDQTWSMAQDKTGMIYIADNYGILQYDGMTWDKFPVENKNTPYSLIYYKDTLFVGADNEVGYLGYDSNQKKHKYVSLMHLFNQKKPAFGRILDIDLLNKGVAYISETNKCLVYQQGKLTLIDPNDTTMYIKEQLTFVGKYKKIWVFNKKMYLQTGQSLFVWNGTKLVKTDEFENLENLHELWDVRDYKQDTLFAYNYRNAKIHWLYLKNGKFIKQEVLNTELDTLFWKILPQIKTIDTGGFTVNIGKKSFLIDKNGKIKYSIIAEMDVPSTSMWNISIDRQGNVWTLGSSGIGQVHANSPLSYWNSRHGLLSKKVISYMTYYNQTLYIGSTGGLSFLNKEGRFEKVSAINNEVWGFCQHQGKLYIACYGAIYEINKKQSPKKIIQEASTPLLMKIDRKSPKLLMFTGNYKLFSLEEKQEGWVKKKIKGFHLPRRVSFAKEDKDGSIWLNNSSRNVFRVWLNPAKDSVIKSVSYDIQDGLPSKPSNTVFQLHDGQVIFGTEAGIYIFDQVSNRFRPHPTLNSFVKGMHVVRLHEIQRGDLFIQIRNGDMVKLMVLKPTQYGGYTVLKRPFKPLQVSLESEAIVELENGKVVIAKDEKLVVYDELWKSRLTKTYQCVIKKVTINNDSLLFTRNDLRSISLDYRFNTLKFYYAGLFYEHSNQNQYQFRLKGFQSTWSKWSNERNAYFTNLPEGSYIFEVRSKNIYGDLSQMASFKFRISPPWYRAWWAYILYFLFASGLLLLALRLNTSRLIRQKDTLEKKIQQRTIQLREKQEEITLQNEDLKNKQEEIITQRTAIENQNKQLLQKNLQVKKSIKAAKVIQDAILPFDDKMREVFNQYFVLFRPRDIVSGDFYWANTIKKNKRIVAAIDCTGHGVPGAFMSMISYALLNEIVCQKDITKPAQVLDQLRSNLMHALQREKTGNRSGMDMALCNILYLPNGVVEITFAGAKRPVYYFEYETQILSEIKGSRISIGMNFRKNLNFEEHTFTLTAGDLIFLSTDGYSDQNNVARRSFGSKRFKKLLAANASKPLSVQKQILEQHLDSHMVGTEQRDDILVIGLRV